MLHHALCKLCVYAKNSDVAQIALRGVDYASKLIKRAKSSRDDENRKFPSMQFPFMVRLTAGLEEV